MASAGDRADFVRPARIREPDRRPLNSGLRSGIQRGWTGHGPGLHLTHRGRPVLSPTWPGREEPVINTSHSPVLPDPAGFSADLAMLVLGWALGILSSPITDAIRRWSIKKRITRAIRTELQTLQDALAVVVLQIARHRGELSYSLLEAILSTLRTSGHVAGTGRALKMIDDLLLTDAGTPSATPPAEPPPTRALLSLRVPGVPFLVAHLHRMDFYPHEIQRQMLEIRAGTQAFEQLGDEAMRYHFLTFREGTDPEYRTALMANVEECYERAAGKASELISQIAALLQSREMRPR